MRRRAFASSIAFVVVLGAAVLGLAPNAGAVNELNFAGPAGQCPGAGWNCTTAQVGVVQVTDGGTNIFRCFTQNCSVTQTATNGGSNTFECNQTSTAASPTQICVFDQTSDTGGQVASVWQRVNTTDTNATSVQSPVQVVTGSQQSTDGGSQIQVDQSVQLAQSATILILGSSDQNQQPYQSVALTQTSENGGQQTRVGQRSEMAQTVLAPLNAQQTQNTGAGIHQAVAMTQANNLGSNRFEVDQVERYSQAAVSVVSSVNQAQGVNGPGNGNQDVSYDINSVVGQSDVRVDQSEEFQQDWVAVLLPITTTQTQIASQDSTDVGGAGSHPNRSTQDQEATLLSRLITGSQTCDQNISAINKDDGRASQFCSKQNLLGQVTGPTVTTSEASGTIYAIHNA